MKLQLLINIYKIKKLILCKIELIQNFWSAKYKIQKKTKTKKTTTTLREKVAIWNIHKDIGTASHLT